MKRVMKLIVVLPALQLSTVAAEAVEDQREWTERFAVSTDEPEIEIHNIWGDVRILSGAEGEITIAIREHRSAPSQALFDRSLEMYGLKIEASGQALLVQVGERRQHWRGDNPCRRCRVEYEFELRVPASSRVFASTVNDGRVEVSDLRGRIRADNVNGPVTIHNATACERVGSVNGEVSLSFATAPDTDCRLETVNGDIRLQLPGGSGLDLAVDLGNGRMMSELPVDSFDIPASVEHREKEGRNVYRIEQAAGLRLAGGGPRFSVSSLNGDLRIQKIQ